jgi:hypothetical protein
MFIRSGIYIERFTIIYTGKEALWLKNFLHEIGVQDDHDINGKILVTKLLLGIGSFGDNQAAITLPNQRALFLETSLTSTI